MSFKILLLIGTGSFIGGVFRYLVSFPLMHKYPHGFPWGTLVVNVIGCLLIGMLYAYADRWYFPKEWRLFLVTGILGGFTTFSAFSNETITLAQNGHMSSAILYVVTSILLGLGATWLGVMGIRLI